MYVPLSGGSSFKKQPAMNDLIGFGCLCMAVLVIIQIHLHYVGYPLSQALECACQSSGNNCREANVFDHHFWDKYWTQDLPAAFDTLNKLQTAEANGRPMKDIAADSSQVTPRRNHIDVHDRKAPQEGRLLPLDNVYSKVQDTDDKMAKSAKRERDKMASSARGDIEDASEHASDLARTGWKVIYPSPSPHDGIDTDEDAKAEARLRRHEASEAEDKKPRKPKPLASPVDPVDPEESKDGSIKWYLSGRGASFEPRGRRRRSAPKEQMLNKPKELVHFGSLFVVDGS